MKIIFLIMGAKIKQFNNRPFVSVRVTRYALFEPWIKLIVGSGGRTVGGGTLPGHAGGLPTA